MLSARKSTPWRHTATSSPSSSRLAPDFLDLSFAAVNSALPQEPFPVFWFQENCKEKRREIKILNTTKQVICVVRLIEQPQAYMLSSGVDVIHKGRHIPIFTQKDALKKSTVIRTRWKEHDMAQLNTCYKKHLMHSNSALKVGEHLLRFSYFPAFLKRYCLRLPSTATASIWGVQAGQVNGSSLHISESLYWQIAHSV